MANLFDKCKDKIKAKKDEKILEKEREDYHKEVLKLEKSRDKTNLKAPSDAFISLKNINKIYPNHVQAVYDFNLDIKEHEFVVFVGPSGCGKSTTLRMIAGLEEITSGDLFINDEVANDLTPKERDVAMVFQSYALYPHMTVKENMSFGLKINHYEKEEIEKRVTKAAEILELTPYLNRKPNALSGGQMQRVALGRAIVRNSKLFLMDEPLSNLDAKLRVQMRSEIVKLHKQIEATTIYVTHDQTEAMTMASRIVVMNKGYIQQIGTPSEIYNNPKNIFVAGFIGSPTMNLLKCVYKNDTLTFKNGYEIKVGTTLKDEIKEFYKNKVKELENYIEARRATFYERNALNLKKIPNFNEFNEEKLENYIKKNKPNDNTLNLESNDKKLLAYKIFLYKNVNKNCIDLINKITSLDSIEEKAKNILNESNFNILVSKEEYLNNKVQGLNKIKQIINEDSYELVIGIRPEAINVTKEERFNVLVAELLGAEYYLHIAFMEDNDLVIKTPVEGIFDTTKKVGIDIDLNKLHYFDPITEEKIK